MATKTSAIRESDQEVAADGSQRERSRLSGADGVRAFAALAVIFHHLGQKLPSWEQEGWLLDWHGVMVKGAIGVSVFFVLSGMLLSFPFWTAYFEKRKMPSLAHYAKRRAQRIMPGFYVALLVSFWVAGIYYDYDDGEVLAPVRRLFAGLTFTAGFDYETLFPTEVNGPLWSISFEVISYVLMPILMIGLFLLARKVRGRVVAWAYWLAGFGGILLVNHWVVQTFQLDNAGKGWQYGIVGGAKTWMPEYNPVGFFAHFAVGILVSAFIVQWKVFHDGRRSWMFDGLALLPIGGIAYLLWKMRLPSEPAQEFSIDGQPYYFPTFALMVGALLALLAYSKLLGRLLDNPFMRYTAKISFGLYIWHHLIMFIVTREVRGDYYYGGMTDRVDLAIISVMVLATSYAVAAISWHVVERPVLEGDWGRWIGAAWRKLARRPEFKSE